MDRENSLGVVLKAMNGGILQVLYKLKAVLMFT